MPTDTDVRVPNNRLGRLWRPLRMNGTGKGWRIVENSCSFEPLLGLDSIAVRPRRLFVLTRTQ